MEYIVVGFVQNTHGLQGHLKIKSSSHFKNERFKKGSKLYILSNGEYIKVIVKNHKVAKNTDVLLFENLLDINLVEKYKGSNIYVAKEDLNELEEDEFYYHELEGLEVYEDEFIGIVNEVREVPQGELLVIKRKDKKNALIPFIKEFVEFVDVKNKRITVKNTEGLL